MKPTPNPFRAMPFPASGGEYRVEADQLQAVSDAAPAVPTTAAPEPTQPAAAAPAAARRHRSDKE